MKNLMAVPTGAVARVLGLSRQYSEYMAGLGRCPLCHKFSWTKPGLFDGDRKLIRLMPSMIARVAAKPPILLQCPRCGGFWPMFRRDENAGPGGSTSMMEPPTVIDVIETKRSEEFVGDEQKVIDNSRSSSAIERKFVVSRSWKQSIVVEYEKARTTEGGAGLDIEGLAHLKLAVTDGLSQKYSLRAEETQSHSEEILIKVAERKKVCVTLRWKQVWQHGSMVVRETAGTEMTIPFKVSLGLTFDQEQIDSAPA